MRVTPLARGIALPLRSPGCALLPEGWSQLAEESGWQDGQGNTREAQGQHFELSEGCSSIPCCCKATVSSAVLSIHSSSVQVANVEMLNCYYAHADTEEGSQVTAPERCPIHCRHASKIWTPTTYGHWKCWHSTDRFSVCALCISPPGCSAGATGCWSLRTT